MKRTRVLCRCCFDGVHSHKNLFGYVHEGLGIHRDIDHRNKWTITHIASGYKCTLNLLFSLRQAKWLLYQLVDYTDWTADKDTIAHVPGIVSYIQTKLYESDRKFKVIR